jgi:hypothetical protein
MNVLNLDPERVKETARRIREGKRRPEPIVSVLLFEPKAATNG